MGSRLLLALTVLAIPAAADNLSLFHDIREKDTIYLVLPAGSCKASVVKRDLYGLTVKLKDTTTACGLRKSNATVARTDVQDVVGGRRTSSRGPGPSRAAGCALLATTIAATTAGFAIGERTGNGAAALAVIAASGAGASFLCRSRAPHYTVFSGRIVAVP